MRTKSLLAVLNSRELWRQVGLPHNVYRRLLMKAGGISSDRSNRLRIRQQDPVRFLQHAEEFVSGLLEKYAPIREVQAILEELKEAEDKVAQARPRFFSWKDHREKRADQTILEGKEARVRHYFKGLGLEFSSGDYGSALSLFHQHQPQIVAPIARLIAQTFLALSAQMSGSVSEDVSQDERHLLPAHGTPAKGRTARKKTRRRKR